MRSLPVAILTIAAALAGLPDAFAAAPNPAESRQFLRSGMQKDQAGDFDGAITDYTRAIELDPKNGLAHVRRGMAHDTRGELKEAADDYAAALVTKNMEANAEAAVYSMRADIYLRQDMRKEATADFDRALKLNPKLFQAYLGRAITRLMTGDFAKAQADYELALKERPDDGASQYGMGIVSYAKQDWPAAESHFAVLQKQSPDDPNVAIWLILAQKRNGKTVNAAGFKSVNQAEWPGPVVAHLLGNIGPLDKFIAEAEEHHDANEGFYTCVGALATFSLVQIEKAIDKTAQDYAKIKPGAVYLNDMQNTFQKCADMGIEGHIALNEIKLLKAR
jgi:tetratricopeptide (TPR) repeat protein